MVTSIKDLSALGTFLYYFAITFRTCDIKRNGLSMFAFRISGTGQELAELTVLNDHGTVAFGAFTGKFDDLLLGYHGSVFCACKLHCIFSFRIILTGEEVSIFTELNHER